MNLLLCHSIYLVNQTVNFFYDSTKENLIIRHIHHGPSYAAKIKQKKSPYKEFEILKKNDLRVEKKALKKTQQINKSNNKINSIQCQHFILFHNTIHKFF